MRDIILCAVTLLLLCFVLKRPWIGAVMLACFSYLNPQRLSFGFAYSLPFFLVTSICTIIGIVVSGKWPRFFWTREIGILFALMVWMNVTYFCALNPQGAHAGWTRMMTVMATLLISAGLIQDRYKLTVLLCVIALSVGFYGIKGGLFTLASGGQYRVDGPADTFLTDNNQLAVALCMCLPIFRYLQLQLTSKRLRLGLTVAMVLTALSVLGTYSRGGFLSLSFVAILIWLKSRRKLLYAATVAICAVGLLTMMPDKWTARMHTIDSSNYDGSVLGRFNAWQFAINLADDRPLIGGGFHSFTPELFQRYAPDPDDYHVAHSIYFEMLGDQGYPGLVLFVGFFVSTWITAAGTRRLIRHRADLQWAGDMAAMLQASIAAYLLGGGFLSLAYFDLPYQLALTALTCFVVTKRELAQSSSESARSDRDADYPASAETIPIRTSIVSLAQ